MYNNIDSNCRNVNYQKKAIFSCNVFKTDHHQPTIPQAVNFRSSSLSSCVSKDPEVLYFNEKLLRRKPKSKKAVSESSTQTSKTILQLAQMEKGEMSPDSLAASPRDLNLSLQNYPGTNHLSDYTLDGSCHEEDFTYQKNTVLDKPLTLTFLEKNSGRIKPPELVTCFKRSDVRSRSFVESYFHPNYIKEIQESKASPRGTQRRTTRSSCKSLDLPDNSFGHVSRVTNCQNTFMCSTAASRIKSKLEEIQSTNYLIPAIQRGRSTSPKPCGDYKRVESLRKVPYIDESKSDSTTRMSNTRLQELKDLSKSELSLKMSEEVLANMGPSDRSVCIAVSKLRDPDWRMSLRGLADIVELCRIVDLELIQDYMTTIYQRLIELLKSQRSHVCRTSCQAAGPLFEYVKDTRRPEFDAIVDILLQKTADFNKFIRQQANLALDCMVTHISTFNAVRALCNTGPGHKNPLVRCATVRLLICAVVIAGPDSIFNPNNNEFTRKRIVVNMARLLEDRNLETRGLAERLYKVLSKEPRFDVYLKKYLEKEQIVKIRRTLRLRRKK